uniref:Ribosomal protein L19 n=1 Tax=Gloeochaete wittrockiana TaxID=38269 RepID=A0A3G1IW19_9EUKA|nr:ribosomal protein L19 [Gloeochaete wittrockiana]ASQ40231.1 ribosomal protein L19 [Gloeochaete wittrockiana]
MSFNTIIESFNLMHPKTKEIPTISIGDTVRLGLVIREIDKDKTAKKVEKERLQPYEGIVIAMKKANSNSTITVRKVFQGVGVEQVFLIHSPMVSTIKILKHAKVRRAKLHFLRKRIGKATKLKEIF